MTRQGPISAGAAPPAHRASHTSRRGARAGTRIDVAFKLGLSRPRPDLHTPRVPLPEGWSHPSAHPMQVTATAIARVLVPARGHPGSVAVAASAVVAVGWSRMHLPVHFPGDVLAGMMAAALRVAGLRALMLRRPAGRKAGYTAGGAA